MMKTKAFLFVVVSFLFSSVAWAYPPSLNGGKTLGSGTAHQVGVGWPSVYYEWWNGGRPDWALRAEVVYGDWAAAFSDVQVGLGLGVPLKWSLTQKEKVSVGLRIAPEILIANENRPGNDIFVFGMMGDIGIPVTIGLHPHLNLVTGVSIPFSVFIPETGGSFFVFPILPRLGIEFVPQRDIGVWFLTEMGPTIGHASGATEVDFGIRIWIGATFF